MTAATICSIRPGASGCSAGSARRSASRAALSPMRGRRSTRSAYHPVSDSIVAAGRIRLGTILGADRDDIAPSRRFYSGGGGSVRGYGYQRLGPARRRRRSDRRPQPGRIRAGGADPAEGVRRQFRDRAVHRRRHAVDRRHARASRTGSSAPASACAIIRASGRSGSTSARRSTAQKGDGRIAVVVGLGQAF